MTKKEQRQVARMFTDEHSVISEYFQILCHNADSMLPVTRNQGHVILLTSTMQGEGKTFISANLAMSFANIGKRVLVIDGDLRKASLSKQLDGKGRKGLSTILLRKVEDPFSVIRTLPEHPGVDILYAGPQVPNPVTLFPCRKWRSSSASSRNAMTPSSLTPRHTASWQTRPSSPATRIFPCTSSAATG